MSKIETGVSAFPVQTSITSDGSTLTVKGSSGLTLRDYFAAKAMSQLIGLSDPDGFEDAGSTASWAYTYADAMLEARK